MILTFLGLYSCVGKQLALMELRYVVAQIVHRFDVKLVHGQSKENFLQGIILLGRRMIVTLVLGPSNLVFSPRM